MCLHPRRRLHHPGSRAANHGRHGREARREGAVRRGAHDPGGDARGHAWRHGPHGTRRHRVQPLPAGHPIRMWRRIGADGATDGVLPKTGIARLAAVPPRSPPRPRRPRGLGGVARGLAGGLRPLAPLEPRRMVLPRLVHLLPLFALGPLLSAQQLALRLVGVVDKEALVVEHGLRRRHSPRHGPRHAIRERRPHLPNVRRQLGARRVGLALAR
mmetsp:Transcript_102816/g.297240  ORF Transcript_102816/g.297240 Transcript_102816/m.297240 type:complete len:214 (-) Transcript_102816:1318-1959(-)